MCRQWRKPQIRLASMNPSWAPNVLPIAIVRISRMDCENLCLTMKLWQALPTATKFSFVSPKLLSVPDGLRANEPEHSHDRRSPLRHSKGGDHRHGAYRVVLRKNSTG